MFLMVNFHFLVFILKTCLFYCSLCFWLHVFFQDLSPDLDKLSPWSVLDILESRKNTGATILQRESIFCLQISCFLNPFHTSLHKVQLLHQSFFYFSIFLPPYVPLSAPCSCSDVSSPLPPINTTEPPEASSRFLRSVPTDSFSVEGPSSQS